jgi:hypothetical protein
MTRAAAPDVLALGDAPPDSTVRDRLPIAARKPVDLL